MRHEADAVASDRVVDATSTAGEGALVGRADAEVG
jgi:hypothetical protein